MPKQRWQIQIYGQVQGVGFRPFVFRLAESMNLPGWVRNSGEGLVVEVEGEAEHLMVFRRDLFEQAPLSARVTDLKTQVLPAKGLDTFIIQKSSTGKSCTVLPPPDLATCRECLEEINNPSDRRYQYPFTNCTQCGPRFSILESLPYDRGGTTMKSFVMCEECRQEYESPSDRRFHAQPIACPQCGPRLELKDRDGKTLAHTKEALQRASTFLEEGKIIALKGLGGFQLLADASSRKAVSELRKRKNRPRKPLALMVPDIDQARSLCVLSCTEERLLSEAVAPIALAQRKALEHAAVSDQVAPDQPMLGIMLPYTPLHHLLMQRLGKPIVATSGNLSEEPICIDNEEAIQRLRDIADYFLVHDRAIRRAVDDSVARVIDDVPTFLRAARGVAPMAINVESEITGWIGMGGQQKNTVAVGAGNHVLLSQHIGDLDNAMTRQAFESAISDFTQIHRIEITDVACDQHPDYASTLHGESLCDRITKVQHHHAHLAACLLDNDMDDKDIVHGIIWDGTGLGTDGTIWGGEFLTGSLSEFQRVGCFKPFWIPGGDQTALRPNLSALGLLQETFGAGISELSHLPTMKSIGEKETRNRMHILEKRLNCYQTSSVGRLFDGVASLLGLCQSASYEGEAAMCVEAAASQVHDPFIDILPFEMENQLEGREMNIVDWKPLIEAIVEEIFKGSDHRLLAARFHATLAEIAVDMATRVDEESVLLAGGCFQNKLLTEMITHQLSKKGFSVFTHRKLPPNDGSLALGQLMVASNLKDPSPKMIR